MNVFIGRRDTREGQTPRIGQRKIARKQLSATQGEKPLEKPNLPATYFGVLAFRTKRKTKSLLFKPSTQWYCIMAIPLSTKIMWRNFSYTQMVEIVTSPPDFRR